MKTYLLECHNVHNFQLKKKIIIVSYPLKEEKELKRYLKQTDVVKSPNENVCGYQTTDASKFLFTNNYPLQHTNGKMKEEKLLLQFCHINSIILKSNHQKI